MVVGTVSALLVLAVGALAGPAAQLGSSYDAPAVPNVDSGYGAPRCQPQVNYITVTSTKVAHTTAFNSYKSVLPTTLYQQLTETVFLPSTVYQTQLVTSYAAPDVKFSTRVLFDTKFVTDQEYHTHTSYESQTKTVAYTETEYESRFTTTTVRAPVYVTQTQYSTEVYPEVQYRTETQYNTQYVTETQRVPNYVTQTVTSAYPEYKYVTETKTQQQYITVTRTQQQNQYVTVCNKPTYPSYGK